MERLAEIPIRLPEIKWNRFKSLAAKEYDVHEDSGYIEALIDDYLELKSN